MQNQNNTSQNSLHFSHIFQHFTRFSTFEVSFSAGQNMATIFEILKGLFLLIVLAHHHRPIFWGSYTESLESSKKRREKLSYGILFHQDNNLAHMSYVSMTAIHNVGFEILEQSLSLFARSHPQWLSKLNNLYGNSFFWRLRHNPCCEWVAGKTRKGFITKASKPFVINTLNVFTFYKVMLKIKLIQMFQFNYKNYVRYLWSLLAWYVNLHIKNISYFTFSVSKLMANYIYA